LNPEAELVARSHFKIVPSGDLEIQVTPAEIFIHTI
jgi:hypothetical protein